MEQLTPNGLAGVAVVRATAAERAALFARLRTPDGRPFASRGDAPQRAVLALAGRDLDDVLVVERGERGLELHVHGAPAVLAALDRAFALRAAAAPTAAARLLRDALSVAQLDLALEQLDRDFARALAELAALPAPARAAARAAAIARSRAAMLLVAAPRIVLVGRQNAGKSTLFNRLLCRERVLAGPTPGLTRDPVAERTELAGYPYELVDTAGEGPAGAAVDAAALQRGRDERRGGLCVLVVDTARGPDALDVELARQCDYVVANKIDLPRAPWPPALARDLELSAATADPAALRAQFGALLRARRGLPPAGPVGGLAALDEAELAALLALPE